MFPLNNKRIQILFVQKFDSWMHTNPECELKLLFIATNNKNLTVTIPTIEIGVLYAVIRFHNCAQMHKSFKV